MKLVRIEAGQFGKIGGRVLDGLSAGLTVVHGPNEAGKSSFTALVRYVLYGYPTPGDTKEAPYLPESGRREGRLVFTDGATEWIIERTEGVRGGPVTVRSIDGVRNDGLATELTSGVSRLAYRVVLGFGLGDLAQIEELKGQDDDLFARLYAASAGLATSPLDVRKAIAASMEELWKKGGSAPALNRAKAEREGIRGRIRELEAQSEQLRAQAARLDEATRELEVAKEARAATQAEAERLGRAIAAAERSIEDATAARDEAARLRVDEIEARAAVARIAADPEALASGDRVDALAEELSGFRAQLDAIGQITARIGALDARLRSAVADTGWTVDQALRAASDAGIGAEIERHRERIAEARTRLSYVTSARDAARVSDAAVPPQGGARAGWLVPGIVVAVLGVAGLLAGLALSQTVAAVMGGVGLVAGTLLAVLGPRTGRPIDGRATGGSTPLERDYAAAEAGLRDATASWSAWVASQDLGGQDDDPSAVAARYQAARAVRDAATERDEATAALGSATAGAEEYASRVREVCAPLVGEEAASITFTRIAEITGRARSRVAAARTAADEGRACVAEAERLARAVTDAERRATEAEAAAAAALEVVGVVGGLESARAADVGARTLCDDAARAYEALAEEVARLNERVGAERREGELAELHLAEEGANQRIAAGIREYAVLAMASRLLTAAQERYERDRQPDVVRHAEAAFVRMTNERYSRISVPIGKDSIEVFAHSGAAVTPGKLSRGTAEQLYLALRIGLIDQLGDAGASLPVLMDDVIVNFSPARAEAAAAAVAELAQRRQVVFFTCHPATAQLLTRVDPTAALIELPGPTA